MIMTSPFEGYSLQGSVQLEAEGDPPLMEELGINPDNIKEKVVSVLTYRHVEARLLSDPDMAGPLLFAVLFGVILLLEGKMHFGYIYGFGVLGGLGIYLVLNLMSQKREVELYLTFSILGYALLPIILLASLGLFMPLTGKLGGLFAVIGILWSTSTAAKFFETVLELQDQWWLAAYPICLMYACFTLMAIF
jgi:hypothetical protein